ncbi:MAG: 23S rRNA (pseudouridine(1915)-N(3))-methyltransferase RlmH, partial [Litoreibacter sp.]|nr:23S rRNA (pseudouridine(1915)-N(3))-methyltransferase RlmH [Litoreibacter sp.]
MRVQICAVGRLRASPERELIEDYLTRFDRTGRALGLGPSSVTEVEDKKNAGPVAEAALLTKQVPSDALICTL